MRLLLDSHALIWAVEHPTKLGTAAKLLLEDPTNELLVSAATIWEIAIKSGMGKLNLTLPYRQWISQAINDLQATILPITIEYADCQAKLPYHHRDPFDRLLIAQTLVEDIPLVSSETMFDQYGIKRSW